jgi:hypothetical protein
VFAALPGVATAAAPLPSGFAPEVRALPAELSLSAGEVTPEDERENADTNLVDPVAIAGAPIVAVVWAAPTLPLHNPAPPAGVNGANTAQAIPADAASTVAPALATAPVAPLAPRDGVDSLLQPAAASPERLTSPASAASTTPVPDAARVGLLTPVAPPLRRLSLRLDSAVEVLAAGSRPAARGEAQSPVGGSFGRNALRLANAVAPTGFPLAPPPEAIGAAPGARLAGQVFASALALATRPGDAPPGDGADAAEPVGATDGAITAGATAPSDPRPIVTATRALDTRQEDWPQRLIDRVEAARDAANAADTRIRLVPEALGKIDIALRQDGTTLHVHFTAEQAATRDLLDAAQPRLAELAAARGLQLGDAGVGAGANQGGRRPPVEETVLANPPASDSGAELPSRSDARIA